MGSSRGAECQEIGALYIVGADLRQAARQKAPISRESPGLERTEPGIFARIASGPYGGHCRPNRA
jgi:hypothetical protein